MNMKMQKKLLRPDLKVQRRKTGLMRDKGHMRKLVKRVAHSLQPSDMPRIAKQFYSIRFEMKSITHSPHPP